MASLMECSLETVINVFHQYSTRLEHHDRLNQREFKQLVKKELPNFLKVGRTPGATVDDGVPGKEEI